MNELICDDRHGRTHEGTQNGATRRSGHRAPRPFNGLRRSTPPALSCRRARKNKIVQSFIAQRPPSPQRSSFGRPRPTPIPLPDHPTVDSGKIKLYKVLLRSAPSRISPSPGNCPATTTLPLPHPNPRGGSVAPPPPPAHSTTPIPASRAARRRPRLLPRPFPAPAQEGQDVTKVRVHRVARGHSC